MSPSEIREIVMGLDMGSKAGKRTFWRRCIYALDHRIGGFSPSCGGSWGYHYRRLCADFRTGVTTGFVMCVSDANRRAALVLADDVESQESACSVSGDWSGSGWSDE